MEREKNGLSVVIMVFDFCSIRKHVERKMFLDDVKVVVSKYFGFLDFVLYIFVEILE